GKQRHEECHNAAYGKHEEFALTEGSTVEIVRRQVISGGGEHGGHREEERKLSGRLSGEFLGEAADECGGRAGNAGHQRERLEESDLQRYRIRNALSRFGFIFSEQLIRKEEENPTEYEHVAYDVDTFQQHVDEIAE